MMRLDIGHRCPDVPVLPDILRSSPTRLLVGAAGSGPPPRPEDLMPKKELTTAERDDLAEETGLVLDHLSPNGVAGGHGPEGRHGEYGGWLVVLGTLAALALTAILISM